MDLAANEIKVRNGVPVPELARTLANEKTQQRATRRLTQILK